MKPSREPIDETQLTEITIQPDGRVFVFGLSAGVLSLLAEMSPQDSHLRQLAQQLPIFRCKDDPPPI